MSFAESVSYTEIIEAREGAKRMTSIVSWFFGWDLGRVFYKNWWLLSYMCNISLFLLVEWVNDSKKVLELVTI